MARSRLFICIVVSHFMSLIFGWIEIHAYTIWFYVKILISNTIPRGSPFPIVMSSLIFLLWKLASSAFIIIIIIRVFHIIISWRTFTGVWMIVSLLQSPGLFSVFWPISIMQLFGLSPLKLLFLNPSVLVSILLWLYQEHQLQLV